MGRFEQKIDAGLGEHLKVELARILNDHLEKNPNELEPLKTRLAKVAPGTDRLNPKNISLRTIAADLEKKKCTVKLCIAADGAAPELWLEVPAKVDTMAEKPKLEIIKEDMPKIAEAAPELQELNLDRVQGHPEALAQKCKLDECGWDNKFKIKCNNKHCGDHFEFRLKLNGKNVLMRVAAHDVGTEDFAVTAKQALAAAPATAQDSGKDLQQLDLKRSHDENKKPVFVAYYGMPEHSDHDTTVVDAMNAKKVDHPVSFKVDQGHHGHRGGGKKF